MARREMLRVFLCLIFLLTSSGCANAFLLTGGSTGGGVTITGVSLSTNSFVTSCADSTVIATISTTTTGGSFTGSYSLSGTDAASFKISSSSLECNGTVAAGTYSINVIATMAGASGSPFTQPETLTGSAAAQTFTFTVVETTGVTQTNVPAPLGIPFCPSGGPAWCTDPSISSSKNITCTDSASNTDLVQEDNPASDVGGLTSFTPAVRWEGMVAIIPTLAANSTLTGTCTVNSGAKATGTDLTAANITGAGYDVTVSIVDSTGTTYTALQSTGLGASGYSNATTAALLGKWRTGGGLATGFISFVPLKTGGGTAHPQLSAKFDTECFKAARTAYNSSTNPIVDCYTDVMMQSGIVQATSGQVADNWYSLSVTVSGGSGSGSCANGSFPTTTPATTLTLTGSNTAESIVTATASAGTPFSVNSIGSVIADGTGYGVIVGYTSSTVVSLGVAKAYSGTTITSGNWKIYGINHPYASRYRVRCIWSPSGTPSNVSVQNGNLYLGSAWNGGSLTGGPFAYFKNSGLVMNYQTAASSITNCPQATCATLNGQAQGTNPTGWVTGFGVPCTFCAFGQYSAASGNFQMYLETSGENQDIGVFPDVYIGALIRYDSNAAATIFQDADKYATAPMNYMDNSTGLTPTMKQGADYALNGAFSGITQVNTVSASITISNWSIGDYSHASDPFALAYEMTGDWAYLDNDVNFVFQNWMGTNPGQSGSQLDRLFFGFSQQRGDGWGERSVGRLALILPDADNNSTPSTVLGWTKTDVNSFLENQTTATNSGVWNSNPLPGTIIRLGTGSCPGGATCNTNFVTPGPRWSENTDNNCNIAPWQHGYSMIAFGNLYEEGMLSANGLALWSWLAEGSVSAVNDTAELQPIPIVPSYSLDTLSGGASACTAPTLYTWTAIYNTTNLTDIGWINKPSPPSTYGSGREPSGTLTLTAKSGSSITATIPTGYLGSGSYYVNGTVTSSDGGVGIITAVPSATTMTISTTATGPSGTHGASFGATSYTNSAWTTAGTQWLIPYAAPGDTPGLEVAGIEAMYTSAPYDDYMQIAQAAMTLINAYLSVSGSSSALSTVYGFTGGSLSPSESIKWNIAVRP